MSKKIYIGSNEIAGSDGKSAYQSWLDQGNVGTEAQFLASLKGADGKDGKDGAQGNTGSSVDYPYELVNNVTTDDATKGLSAAQGKELKSLINTVAYNVQTIIDNLANIAYIGAVPGYEDMGVTSPTWTITTNLTNYTMAESISEVVRNHHYENTLVPDSGYDFGTAVITMGGVDITEDCFDATTGEISIAVVTGNIVISGVAERAATIDLAFNGISMTAQEGGYTWLGFRNPNRTLSPLVKCKAGDSITFSVNAADTNVGILILLNGDFEFVSYYAGNANPRTITLASTSTTKYCALNLNASNFANSYITNNTTGDSFDGSTFPAAKLLSADSFRELSPLSRNIPWENERGDMMNWNGQPFNTANFISVRETYEATIYTTIGKYRPDTLPDCFYSKKIDLTNVTKNENNQSLLTFYCGSNIPASYGPVLLLIDDQQQYQNYFSAQAQERAVAVGPRYNAVILSSYAANYADCYIKDTGTDEILWSGASNNE